MSKKTAKPRSPALYPGGRVKLPGGVQGPAGGPVSAPPGGRVKLPGGVQGPRGGPVRAKPAARAKKTTTKARQLALGEAVACCAAEALAASLRLTGWRVSDRDVLSLYELTADDPDAGASILATLEAAAEHGLAGAGPTFNLLDALTCGNGNPFTHYRRSEDWPTGLLLGVDLPGPHTVYDDGTTWWSWGQPFDPASFPGAVIEEAWALSWESA